MRIIQFNNPANISQLMRDIKVDPYGIKIMSPKAITHLVKVNSVSNIAANILKQEMLSLGGDVALARDALTGRVKKTDCLLIGNLSQFTRLGQKLKIQPFGLAQLSSRLSKVISNYQKSNFTLSLGHYKINLSRRAHIMGIVNLTPDSFSADGLYQGISHILKSSGTKRLQEEAVDFAQRLTEEGADIIDVGGQSSRPQALPVSLKEEIARTIPVIRILTKKIKVPVSIDTYKPEVARQALDNGAVMVNDITGLRSEQMIDLIARYRAAVVIMHMQGNPRTMQKHPVYQDLIGEIIKYLQERIDKAVNAGVGHDKIIIDPGIGFGKTLEHNLEILKKLKEFKVLGLPILVGTSRKSFIRKILKTDTQESIFGTVASCVLALKNGANIVRVHDVMQVKQAFKIFDAMDKIGN